MKRAIVFVLPAILLLALPCFLRSETVHVPGDHPTIQEGIDAARDGDTVLVAAGTYTGAGNRDLDFRGKWITVKSESGPEATVIDCEELGRGFYFHSGETAESILEGFTITGGSAEDGYIGAVCCIESSPAIRGNIITDNPQGGIYCNVGAAPAIVRNIIARNRTGEGGGIYCLGSPPTIEGNVIRENTAKGAGGGIHCFSCSPAILDNEIVGNSAVHGGGIHCNYAHPLIAGNVIIRNTCEGNGGGMFLTYYSHPTIIHNTIAHNSARDRGGGICLSASYPTEKTTATNTILWMNKPEELFVSNVSWLDITYSDVRGFWPGAGNMDADPLFLDAESGNYRLADVSPCIGGGIIIEDRRVSPSGSNPDIGAFESTLARSADVNRDGVVDVLDLGLVIEAFGEDRREGADQTDVDGDGRTDVADLVIVARNM